jgi:hypothetical protein
MPSRRPNNILRRQPPSSKPVKLMRRAIEMVLHENVRLPDPLDPTNKRKIRTIRKFRAVAEALVTAAINGDIAAIREINERIDGKVRQEIAGTGEGGAIPIDIRGLTVGQLEQLKTRIAAGLLLDAQRPAGPDPA